MSTFNGWVEEFPEIRIDQFCRIPGKKPPLVCFLSHIHSDHLKGLESLRSPFVYCSPATRELLLRLEKYPQRMNFAKGIIETRKQTYKHLNKLLKTIPLNTPAQIECGADNILQVTLLDANHCAGAVMFLIEANAKAILYTGDIRSEPWWVNSLVRNPVILPFSHGHRRLDRIYLDTTFASKNNRHRSFPTKAAGISELLDKVSKYPKDTVFHLHAWTPGYEDVWVALSSALKSQVHVDDYKRCLYSSLSETVSGTNPSHEGPALFGFTCGNRSQSGCLTVDPKTRLHSCEHGSGCPVVKKTDTVFITSILSRSANGEAVLEMGAGGGAGDLVQAQELELDSMQDIVDLTKVCNEKIGDKVLRTRTLKYIFDTILTQKKSLPLGALNLDINESSIPLAKLVQRLSSLVEQNSKATVNDRGAHKPSKRKITSESGKNLPTSIQFPFSRHSSYEELCGLVGAFKPLDVYPCTVDDENWSESTSVEALFGHLCSGTIFAHDQEMKSLAARRADSIKDDDGDNSPERASKESTEDILSSPGKDVDDKRKGTISLHPALDEPENRYRFSKRRRIDPMDSPKLENPSQAQQQMYRMRQSLEHQLEMGAGFPDADKLGETLDMPTKSQRADHQGLNDRAGEFLLSEVARTPNAGFVAQSPQSSPESQITISNAAFDSQSPARISREKDSAKVQRRKEAYRAAKGLDGTWEHDHSLVASFDGHCGEELEF